MTDSEKQQKIIHIDMDCFYAAIEIRDNPALKDKPVAVGGSSDRRGVLCTCNYLAREYGVRSAMATATAYRHCKDLILLPVDMPKYREVAKRIHRIFHEYTDLVEPLALDEAYLDVSHSAAHQGSASLIAKAIREKILDTEQLTASAGVAPNKFLAKIASGWKKPNALFVIRPHEVEDFVQQLKVDELWGVGKVTAEKLHRLQLKTCLDLQKLSLVELTQNFGKLGRSLYHQCRGLDSRRVEPNRERKSLSIEHTFSEDLRSADSALKVLRELYQQFLMRLKTVGADRFIKNQFIKIKFNDFKSITAEVMANSIAWEPYENLFAQAYAHQQKPIRLLGLGVHFQDKKNLVLPQQQSLF